MSNIADADTGPKRARLQTEDASTAMQETPIEYKPSAGNSSMSNSGYTISNTLSRMPTKDTGIMTSSFVTTPASKLSALRKHGSKRALLEIELIQNKINNQKVKFEKELAHQTEMFDIEYKVLLLEYEHKKKMFALVEAEQKAKLDKIRNEF